MARSKLCRMFRKMVSKTVLHCEQLEDRRLLAAVIGNQPYAPNELLVQYVANANASQKAQALGLVKGSVAETIHTKPMQAAGMGQLERVKLGSGVGMQAAINALSKSPFVKFAEPNYVYRTSAVSNDPYYTPNGQLWGMYSDDSPTAGPSGTTNLYGSQAEKAWNAGYTGSSSVVVGIIDEGIDVSHPDLKNNIWSNPFDKADGIDNDGNGYVDDVNGWDFYYGNSSVYDAGEDQHGTHVAGTIGGEGGNGIGVAGVTWDVTMISAKFLGPQGGYLSDAVQALDYLTDLKTRHGMNIVASNNSWGGGGYSSALHAAIIRHANANILFVAAAGNSASNNDSIVNYPSNYNSSVAATGQPAASYDNVIAVASITSGGGLSSFSNYGATTVDIGAPGSSIWSTLPGNTYGNYSGTSMATPHVTGAVALYAASQASSVSAAAIKQAILSTATPTTSLTGKTVTGGRLNVFDALQGVAGFTVSPPSPNAFTSEANATPVTFGVRLNKQPTGTVTVNVKSSDESEGTVVGGPSLDLIFDQNNWNTVQTVTVNGVNDTVYDSNIPYSIVLTSSTSAPEYVGLDPADVALTNLDNDPIPPTKFYVVNDSTENRTYEYDANGQPIENYLVNSGNATPRGVAMTAAGDKVWVVDANRKVYIYNTAGLLLGSWTASTLATSANVQGIATDGTHIWIVDSSTDRVFYYANAASRVSGKQTATSFPLATAAGNTTPTDLVFGLDANNSRFLWVVDDGTNKVFRYSVSSTGGISPVGNWQLDSSNSTPTGIALDPSNGSQDIWVVDSGTDRVYQYANGRTLTAPSSTNSFALAAGNTNPQGIADPPAMMRAMSGSSSTIVSASVPSVAVPMIASNAGTSDLVSRTASAQSQLFVRSSGASQAIAEAGQLSVSASTSRPINATSTLSSFSSRAKAAAVSGSAGKLNAAAHDAVLADLSDLFRA